MSIELDRFPLKAKDAWHRITTVPLGELNEVFEEVLIVQMTAENYESLAACWHSVHGDRAIRVYAHYCESKLYAGTKYLHADYGAESNATLILDEETQQ